MSDNTEQVPALIDSIEDLVQHSELTSIRVYEVAGRRVTHEEDAVGQSLAVQARASESDIETRVKLEQRTPDALLLADIGATYTLDSEFEVAREVLREFTERVGVMSVFPFLRESILTTATRLGTEAPVLGLLRAGAFRIEDTQAEAPDGPDAQTRIP